jgi:hypothetical protein
MLLISEMELPQDADGAAFSAFLRDEYLPAVHTGPTRVGQVEDLEFAERETTDGGHRFLRIVRWSGIDPGDGPWEDMPVRVDDEAVLQKLASFGAKTTRHARWQEVARLPDATETP